MFVQRFTTSKEHIASSEFIFSFLIKLGNSAESFVLGSLRTVWVITFVRNLAKLAQGCSKYGAIILHGLSFLCSFTKPYILGVL
jgi:hypothetical protein